MVVLHCNGRTCGNAYLITFKVGPLRTHALAPSILPLLEPPAEGFLWNHSEFGRRVRLGVPLRPIFRVGNSQKSLGARSGEYGGWVIIVIIFVKEYKLLSSLCSLLDSPVTSCLSGTYILPSTLFSNTLCSSLAVRASFTPIQNYRQNCNFMWTNRCSVSTVSRARHFCSLSNIFVFRNVQGKCL
jgi:hypothetical protein